MYKKYGRQERVQWVGAYGEMVWLLGVIILLETVHLHVIFYYAFFWAQSHIIQELLYIVFLIHYGFGVFPEMCSMPRHGITSVHVLTLE